MTSDLKLSLLKTYNEILIPEWLDKSVKKKVKNLILIGTYGQVGIALIRMCLKIGIPIKSITNTKIAFTHKLLKIYTQDKALDAMSSKNNIVIYTGPIHKLNNYEKIFDKISHLICFSSTSIFTKATNSTEDSKEVVKNLEYGEKFVLKASKKYGFTVNIVRPTMIYGYDIDNNINLIRKYIQKCHFFPVYKGGRGLRQPVHTEDLSSAILALLCQKKPQTKDYNLAGGEILSYKEMVKRIFLSCSLLPIIPNIPFMPFLIRIIKPFTNPLMNPDVALNMEKDFAFSCTKAKKDFNYNPRKFTLN